MAAKPLIRLLGLIALIPLLALCAEGRNERDAPSRNQTGSKMVRLRVGPEDAIGAIAFSPNGRVLAAATERSIFLWNQPHGTLIARVIIPNQDDAEEVCRYLAFSPDGKRLVTVHRASGVYTAKARLRLWDVLDRSIHLARTIVRSPPGPIFGTWRVEFSPASKMLVAGTPPLRSLLLWDLATGREVLHFYGGVAATFAPDGRSLVSVGPYGRIHHWAAGTNRLLDPVETKPLTEMIAAQNVVFSSDACQVAIGDGYSIWLKSTAAGRTQHRLEAVSPLHPLQFSPDGRFFAATNGPGISFFDTATGKEKGWARGQGILAFSPDGQTIAAVQGDTIAIEEASTLLCGKAPTAAATTPPGVPLQAELIVHRDTYMLDRGGLTVEEFADEAFAKEVAGPKLRLTLRLRNAGDQPLRLHNSRPEDVFSDVYLLGPCAINYFELCQTCIGFDDVKPLDITLKPGASFTVPVKSLQTGPYDTVFWASPGQYQLRAQACVYVTPAPKGTEPDDRGFGTVWVRCPPITLHVKALTGPPEEWLERLGTPPPLGSLVPPPEDEATRHLRRILDWRADLDSPVAAGASLKDVMEFFHDRYGMAWCVDEPAFRKLGKNDFAQTKTLGLARLVGITVDTAIYLVLNPLGADYEIRDGKLCIVPLVRAKSLADRVGPPQRWLREKLKEPQTLRGGIAAGTPLRDALERLAALLEVPVVIDTPTFARAGTKAIERKLVGLAEEKDVPMHIILDRLLQPLGATFVARDNLVVIVPMVNGGNGPTGR